MFSPLQNPPHRCSPAAGLISLRDPSFSFPAGSLALSSLNKHTEAVVYYKKALELDPDNDTYKSNLKIAEQKMKETPSPVSSETKGLLGGGRVGRGFVALDAAGQSLDQLGCVSGESCVQTEGRWVLPPAENIPPKSRGSFATGSQSPWAALEELENEADRRERSDAAALP